MDWHKSNLMVWQFFFKINGDVFKCLSLKVCTDRVKNDRFFFKYPLFCLANNEIWSGNIQNNIFDLNFPAPSYAEFLHLHEDKREAIGISKMYTYIDSIRT